MDLQQGEHVIWSYGENKIDGKKAFLLGGIVGYGLYKLASNKDLYVVTNLRAMWIKKDKIVSEVPLNTPNLVIGTAGSKTNVTYSPFTGSSSVRNKVDIIFVANGVELLRFKDVDAGAADELFVKLKSMGFNVM